MDGKQKELQGVKVLCTIHTMFVCFFFCCQQHFFNIYVLHAINNNVNFNWIKNILWKFLSRSSCLIPLASPCAPLHTNQTLLLLFNKIKEILLCIWKTISMFGLRMLFSLFCVFVGLYMLSCSCSSSFGPFMLYTIKPSIQLILYTL